MPSDARYLGLSKEELKNEDVTIIQCLKKLLVDRASRVKNNPLILDWTSDYYDPWSQSTVFYRLRDLYLIPLEQKYGITIIKESTREYITSRISEICEKGTDDNGNLLIGQPRERLGITANARAVMYYRGVLSNVDIDEISNLALNGTDVIFVEKRGIVDQLKHIADRHAIAFVSTQGHFAEYPRDLIVEIVKHDGYVIILTDFDCAGINIAENVISEVGNECVYIKNMQVQVIDRVKRLGIDMSTLDYFVDKGIDIETVDEYGNQITVTITSVEQLQKYCEENYPRASKGIKYQQPGLNVVSPIIDYLKDYMKYEQNPAHCKDYERFDYIVESFEHLTGLSLTDIISCIRRSITKKEELDDIKDIMSKRWMDKAKRIELDSVISVVNAVRFGEYVCDKLVELFPNRNGLRAVVEPTNYFGDKFTWFNDCTNIKELFEYITETGDKAVEQINKEINDYLQNVEGLLDINLEEASNEYNRICAIADDERIKEIDAKCSVLLQHLKSKDAISCSNNISEFELLVCEQAPKKQHDNKPEINIPLPTPRPTTKNEGSKNEGIMEKLERYELGGYRDLEDEDNDKLQHKIEYIKRYGSPALNKALERNGSKFIIDEVYKELSSTIGRPNRHT